jgi:pimeloyl-ACP methyl ester carboxylesterase
MALGGAMALWMVVLGWPGPADAARRQRAFVAAPQRVQAADVPGCPDQGGILDSITVPVDQPLELSVVTDAPAPEGGASFNISSDNPAFVAAGDRVQGFIPRVTIPEGGTQSNAFTLYGIAVGQTRLRLTALTQGYSSGSYPLGAWDINKSGTGRDQKLLDANAPARSCRVTDGDTLSADPATLASCGQPVRGVVADGVNALLLRTASGLAGTACFELVSAGDDQGTVQAPLGGTVPVGGLNYGFSYYTPPQSFGASSAASRKVTLEYSFTPSIGNGNTSRLRAEFDVVRPPVVLVHGLWSNGASWQDGYLRNDAQNTTLAADYAGSNAASFSVNADVLRDIVAEALDTTRRKGYAGTQSDVIGHSMGGLLSRRYVAADDYKRAENLGQGDLRRLVTLDTPHWGSSFANLLVSVHAVGGATATRLETTVTSLTSGGDMRGGAVCDLAENSPALAELGGGTALRSVPITATGGPAGTPAAPADYWGGVTWFGINSFESALTQTYCSRFEVGPFGDPVCVEWLPVFPQDRVDAFRFREGNDAVVGLASQRGGLTGSNYPGLIHFHVPAFGGGITDDGGVTTRVRGLLDGPPTALAAAWPGVPSDAAGTARTVPGMPSDAADYSAGCAPGGPLKPVAMRIGARRAAQAAVDPRVNIVAPAAGTMVTVGSPLTVVVELSPPLTAQNTVGVVIGGLGRVEAAWFEGLRFAATLPDLPPLLSTLTLTPDVTAPSGQYSTGAPITIVVKPTVAPTSLTLQRSQFTVRPGTLPRQLVVRGRLPDGSTVDLSQGVTGTTYETSDPAVVGVDANGRVTIIGAGQAQVTVQNASLSATASFVVQDPGAPPVVTVLTGQFDITRGGLRLDRNTGFFVQQVTVRNRGPAAASVPLALVLSGLPTGVTLVSKSGLTESQAPLGRPYVLMRPGGDGLSMAAGAQLVYTFQFLNPGRVAIGYTLDVIAGTPTP